MRKRNVPLNEPLGPWTAMHSLGASIVVLIFLAIALAFWPGWPWLAQWWGVANGSGS